MRLDPSLVARVARIANACALAVVALGVVVLAGWQLRVQALKSVIPGVDMNPATAVAFLASGAALWLALPEDASKPRRAAAAALAGFVLAVGALKLAAYASGFDVGFDQWLFRSELARVEGGNEIAANTALNFALVGGALGFLALGRTARERRWSRALALATTLIGFLVVLGYAFGVREFYVVGRSYPMAIHTGAGFVVLATGVLLARPSEGLLGVLVVDDEGGRLARRLLPFALLVPLVLGALSLAGERLGYYASNIGVALFTVSIMAIFAVALLVQARLLSRADSTRREIEARLQLSERNLVEAEESALLGSATIDLRARSLQWSPGLFRLFEFDPARAPPTPDQYLERWHPDDRHQFVGLRARLFEGAVPEPFEARFMKRDGAVRWMRLRFDSILGADGRPARVVTTVQDVTLERDARAAMERARREAESAALAKSQFLANMSHEIRTPMNAVIGMTSLLLDTPLDERQREYASTIRTSGEHLLAIINDILDLSKIESGRLELDEHAFSLPHVVEEALDLVAPMSAGKDLDLLYDLGPDVPPTLMGDAGRLRQVLVNLLSNAVKFTPSGEVLTTITAAPSPDGRVELRVAVRDTGIGIPTERLDRLFRMFSQVDASTTREFGGTGLGLAITRRLVELMGGSIGVESAPGRGSTFTFTALLRPAPGVEGEAVQSDLLRGARLLIVDDNETNVRIVRVKSEAWGMSPRSTTSPREALSWIERGDPFDVVVLDHHMPEMDGVELARRIRALRPARPPLVLLASSGGTRDSADSRLFAATLTKPVRFSTLYDTMVSLLSRAPERQRVAPSAPRAPPVETKPLRILLTEDNAVNQKVALRMLERLGYRADVAANGQEAMQALERQPYDLVLMDVQMPVMDGLEATRRIRQKWPARPRIVGLTAHALEEDRQRCLDAGMDDHLPKPIALDALEAVLREAEPT